MERYLRVNLLGPGPRLMKKEFTEPRSHKGSEHCCGQLALEEFMELMDPSLDRLYRKPSNTRWEISRLTAGSCLRNASVS